MAPPKKEKRSNVGRPAGGVNLGEYRIALYEDERNQFDEFITRHGFRTRREATVYLLNLEKQHSLGACQDVGQCKEMDTVQFQVALPREDWRRYVRLFQLRYPSLAGKTHGQKLSALIETVENSESIGRSAELDEKLLTPSVHGKRAAAPEIPATPAKRLRQESADGTPDSGLSLETSDYEPLDGARRKLFDETEDASPGQGVDPAAKTHPETSTEASAEPEYQLFLSREPAAESLVIVFTLDLRRKYRKFFGRHGWLAKPEAEKLAILLAIAENPDHSDIRSSISKIAAVYRYWRSMSLSVCGYQTVSDETTGVILRLTIPMSESMWERFRKFSTPEPIFSNEATYETLIDLAEAHPGLMDRTNSSTIPKDAASKREPAPQDRRGRFFQKHGWTGLSDDAKMDTLLDLAEEHTLFCGDRLTRSRQEHIERPERQVQDAQANWRQWNQLIVIAPLSVGQKFEVFFDKHGWSNYTDTEKLGILVGLAETFPAFSKVATKFKLKKAIASCGASSRPSKINDVLGVASDSTQGTWTVIIPMTNSLRQRFMGFFEARGWCSYTAGSKLSRLLQIAQMHPYFGCKEHQGTLSEVSTEIQERFRKFFDYHGWDVENDSDRLKILLDLAESHQSLAETGLAGRKEKISFPRKKRPKVDKDTEKVDCSDDSDDSWHDEVSNEQDPVDYSDDSDGSWHDGVSKKADPKSGKDQTKPKSPYKNFHVIITPSVRQEVLSFFGKHGWLSLKDRIKFDILLQLAETHPDLHDNCENLPVFRYENRPEHNGRYPPSKSTKSMCWQITWSAWEKYEKLMTQHGWTHKTRSQQVHILLQLVNTHPAFFADDEERPRFKKLEFLSDEETRMEDDNRRKAIRELKESKDNHLQLLKSDYYMKFSEEARTTCPEGSKRTYAALANTRRQIVERRQLKQLIAGNKCRRRYCQSLIDYKSIKIKDIGFVVKVTAHCTKSAKHTFTWASSARATHHRKYLSSAYVLNTVITAAIHISGGHATKFRQFARALNLTWVNNSRSDKTANLATASCMTVVKKCFKTTQQEMLDRLKQDNDRHIVLAGDGQFDSPGSCALLCTYTLMVAGVEDKDGDAYKWTPSGYVISQSVIDRRHADNNSTNMERIGLHWALQPVFNAGVKVAELVTDDHNQITSDFRKIKSAAAKRTNNEDDPALAPFRDSLATALLHFKPAITLEGNLLSLLSCYSGIHRSSDIWHKAKNVLQTVSTIATSAPSKEQQCYRRYAKMLRNYLWECSQGSLGDPKVFVKLWTAMEFHLKGDHSRCPDLNLHSKTKLMSQLDQSTKSFDRLISYIQRVADDAAQLCRFRKTGLLESYNSLTLAYCPKRIPLPYDTMIMRRDLAALDHNHHLIRPYLTARKGGLSIGQRYRKSSKGYSLSFRKEAKDYAYIGHLMAAILHHRQTTLTSDIINGPLPKSAANPLLIQKTYAARTQSLEETCTQWIAKQRAAQNIVARSLKWKAAAKKKNRSENDDTSDEDEPWDYGRLDSDSDQEGSEDEWTPSTSAGRKGGKGNNVVKRQRGRKS